ncbi:hypothetical protein NA78x_002892 [Anatilimnocola sp. NA78]|uniref:hypothetical protein n=1 Tax=Anatilimnocola sp. NA78 TaxID=3415683 RepID=UPI003CE5C59B
MTQCELDAAVSAATGEDLREIRRLGFSVVSPLDIELDAEPLPQLVDWDAVDLMRRQATDHVPSGWGF